MDIETYWKTKDGRVIAIRDMGDDHLDRAFVMMRRRVAGTFSCVDEGLQYLIQLSALGEEKERRERCR